jgi:hypothetical protein
VNSLFDTTRRIEDLERRLAEQETTIAALAGRLDQMKGLRWAYLAKTTRVYGQNYPSADGTNTFNLVFVDRQYTPAEGVQTVTDFERSANPQAIGTTVNGQWVLEDELVLAIPAPPPPGSTGKGRWHIVPFHNWYFGKLNEELTRLGDASMSVWDDRGGWHDSGFDQTVHDRLLPVGGNVDPQTWGTAIWYFDRWIFFVSGCEPDV